MAKVLLVDGDRNFRWTLKLLLLDEGHQIEEAADALEAAELLSRRLFDVVITENCFARGTGLDVLNALFCTPTTRCIVATATPTQETRTAAKRLKTCRYLEKPCAVELLLCAIRAAAHEALCQKSSTWSTVQVFAPSEPAKSVLKLAV